MSIVVRHVCVWKTFEFFSKILYYPTYPNFRYCIFWPKYVWETFLLHKTQFYTVKKIISSVSVNYKYFVLGLVNICLWNRFNFLAKFRRKPIILAGKSLLPQKVCDGKELHEPYRCVAYDLLDGFMAIHIQVPIYECLLCVSSYEISILSNKMCFFRVVEAYKIMMKPSQTTKKPLINIEYKKNEIPRRCAW